MAGLRTGKIDILSGKNEALVREGWSSVLKTSPEIKWKRSAARPWAISLKVDNPELPTYDVRVRQALALALDQQAIKNEYYGGDAEVLVYPVSKWTGSGFTPLEELPEDIRKLFEYHPDKAKELLAEAGYPNGFKATVTTHGTSEVVDLLSIVKDNWSKIGVDLELDVKESGVWKSIQSNRSNSDMFFYNPSTFNDQQIYTQPAHFNNTGFVDDPYINERRAGVWAFENRENQAERQRLLGEIQLHDLRQVYWIQMANPLSYNLWWPWVQNYHGEFLIGYGQWYSYPIYPWMDQDMKKAMTGR